MNARGSTEVIVASLGLSMGALSQSLFTIIVAMAVVTTMAMPPMLRWALARLPLRPEEKGRIEREEFEARGFLANIERLLIAVDDSPSGGFASRLAGLLTGSRRIPSTVLQLGPTVRAGSLAGQRAELEAIVKDTAGAAQIEAATRDVGRTGADVTTRAQQEPPERAVAVEARKGYGLLIIGVEPNEKVADVVAAVERPVVITVARGRHRQEPAGGSELSILLPVTGTENSRRGAEIGLALARASLGSVMALHVARRRRAQGLHRFRPGLGAFGDNAASILQEAVRLGDQFGVPVRTPVRTQVTVETAILTQLEAGEHNLVVMGVSPRLGTTLSFGDAATAVLERSERSILFVVS